MFDGVITVWEEIPKPFKILLISLFSTMLILGFISLILGEEKSKKMKDINELQENLTTQVEGIAIGSAEETSSQLKSAFDKAGNELAENVNDPQTKETIKSSMSFAGAMLGLLIITLVIQAITGKR